MLMAENTLQLTPSESVTIRASSQEVLSVEATYGPKGKPPPKHFHPQQDERFEVMEGTLRVKIGDDDLRLSPGDEIVIPRGVTHQMWNPGDVPARARWETTPRGRTERWFRDIAKLQSASGDGKPGTLAYAVLVREYRDTFRLAAGPPGLARGGVAALARLGRLFGRSPHPAGD